jgi:hypothetical protein
MRYKAVIQQRQRLRHPLLDGGAIRVAGARSGDAQVFHLRHELPVPISQRIGRSNRLRHP